MPRHTPAQQMASHIAQCHLQQFTNYQASIQSALACDASNTAFCRSDIWNLQSETLDGDFAVDHVLTSALAQKVAPATSENAPGSWLRHYLLDGAQGAPSSKQRVIEEMKGAALGPGNILGNTKTLVEAGNAALHARTERALNAGVKLIQSGEASRIQINKFMVIYNANTNGRGAPRARIRITGLPSKVVMPAIGEDALRTYREANRFSAALQGARKTTTSPLAQLIANTHWSGTPSFLKGALAGFSANAILTIAPSAAIDAYNNYNKDLSGKMDWRQFTIDSAKSQSGNILGAIGSAGVVFVVGGAATASAPVILASLGVGLFIQLVWGATGGSDFAGSMAESALK